MSNDASKIFGIHNSSVISKQAMHFIYSMVCGEEYTEEDIETYISYEADNDKDKAKLIHELIHSCKVYSSKCKLLGKPCAEADSVIFESEYVDGRINQKFTVRDLTPQEIEAQEEQAVGIIPGPDDDDTDPF